MLGRANNDYMELARCRMTEQSGAHSASILSRSEVKLGPRIFRSAKAQTAGNKARRPGINLTNAKKLRSSPRALSRADNREAPSPLRRAGTGPPYETYVAPFFSKAGSPSVSVSMLILPLTGAEQTVCLKK